MKYIFHLRKIVGEIMEYQEQGKKQRISVFEWGLTPQLDLGGSNPT